MKDLIVPVNNEAHSRALISVVGEETAQVVLRAYTAIDSAMNFGYERGLKDAAEAAALEPEPKLNAKADGAAWDFRKQAEPDAAKAFESMKRDTFDNGYDQGFHDAQADQKASGDTYEHGSDQGFSAAWDDGHTRGFAEGYVKAANESDEQGAYDEGYIDGVSDARVSPAEADANVAELCNPYEEDEVGYHDADYIFDGTYDEDGFNEGDSGDEDTYYDWHTDMEEQLAKTPVIPEHTHDTFDEYHSEFGNDPVQFNRYTNETFADLRDTF